MKTMKTDYGYKFYKEKDSDIEVYNEDGRLVAAFSKNDIKNFLKKLKF